MLADRWGRERMDSASRLGWCVNCGDAGSVAPTLPLVDPPCGVGGPTPAPEKIWQVLVSAPAPALALANASFAT